MDALRQTCQTRTIGQFQTFGNDGIGALSFVLVRNQSQAANRLADNI